jgi:hypothetical protein
MESHWTCPFCNRDATIQSANYETRYNEIIHKNYSEKYFGTNTLFIVCPNKECRRFTLKFDFYELEKVRTDSYKPSTLLNSWDLIPQSKAKAFPSYIPTPIIDNYNEACLIMKLSPKASATLSRRCIQGILRDFWKVKPGKLIEEIESIKDKVEPDVYEAIDSVRRIGNIGAHMEKDINIIVDVDPNEAELLVGLIEILLTEWYVARELRKEKLKKIKDISVLKADKKIQT